MTVPGKSDVAVAEEYKVSKRKFGCDAAFGAL
jgi:hypothetical protein